MDSNGECFLNYVLNSKLNYNTLIDYIKNFQKIDLNLYIDKKGNTLLHKISEYKNTDIVLKINIINLILKKNEIDINKTNEKGMNFFDFLLTDHSNDLSWLKQFFSNIFSTTMKLNLSNKGENGEKNNIFDLLFKSFDLIEFNKNYVSEFPDNLKKKRKEIKNILKILRIDEEISNYIVKNKIEFVFLIKLIAENNKHLKNNIRSDSDGYVDKTLYNNILAINKYFPVYNFNPKNQSHIKFYKLFMNNPKNEHVNYEFCFDLIKAGFDPYVKFKYFENGRESINKTYIEYLINKKNEGKDIPKLRSDLIEIIKIHGIHVDKLSSENLKRICLILKTEMNKERLGNLLKEMIHNHVLKTLDQPIENIVREMLETSELSDDFFEIKKDQIKNIQLGEKINKVLAHFGLEYTSFDKVKSLLIEKISDYDKKNIPQESCLAEESYKLCFINEFVYSIQTYISVEKTQLLLGLIEVKYKAFYEKCKKQHDANRLYPKIEVLGDDDEYSTKLVISQPFEGELPTYADLYPDSNQSIVNLAQINSFNTEDNQVLLFNDSALALEISSVPTIPVSETGNITLNQCERDSFIPSPLIPSHSFGNRPNSISSNPNASFNTLLKQFPSVPSTSPLPQIPQTELPRSSQQSKVYLPG